MSCVAYVRLSLLTWDISLQEFANRLTQQKFKVKLLIGYINNAMMYTDLFKYQYSILSSSSSSTLNKRLIGNQLDD